MTDDTKSSVCTKEQVSLRELELKTKFEIKTLSDSYALLREDFVLWRDRMDKRLEAVKQQATGLNNRLNIVIALIGVQLLNAPAFVMKLIGL